MASPMAVPCTPVAPSASRSIPSCRASRSVPGGTSTAALPANATRPTLNSSGRPSTNRRAASFAAAEPVRFDVGGEHRRGDVHRHHHRGPFPGHPHLGAGSGEADHQQRQHGQEEPGRHVPTPGGPVRRHPVQQPQVGEADRVPAASALHQQVAGDQGEHAEQQPEPQRATARSRGTSPGPPAGAAASRRWACTCRTMSALQSPSVRSGRWVAPLRRSAWRPGRAGRRRRRRTARAADGPGPHLAPPAGLRVDQRDQADVRQLQLTRVGHLDGQHLVPDGEPAQRRAPRARACRGRRAGRRGSRRPPRPGPAGWRSGARASSPSARSAAAAGAAPSGRGRATRGAAAARGAARAGGYARCGPGSGAARPGAQHLGAEAVADAGGEEADRRDGGHRQLPLVQLGGAELHAGAAVDQQPGGQLPVGVDLAGRAGRRSGRSPPSPSGAPRPRPAGTRGCRLVRCPVRAAGRGTGRAAGRPAGG